MISYMKHQIYSVFQSFGSYLDWSFFLYQKCITKGKIYCSSYGVTEKFSNSVEVIHYQANNLLHNKTKLIDNE